MGITWGRPALVRNGPLDGHAIAFPLRLLFWAQLHRGPWSSRVNLGCSCRCAIPQLKRSNLYKICGGSAAFRYIGFCFLQLHVVKGAKGAGVALDSVYLIPAAAAGGIAYLQPGPAVVDLFGRFGSSGARWQQAPPGVIPELQNHTAVLPIAGHPSRTGPGGEGVANAFWRYTR